MLKRPNHLLPYSLQLKSLGSRARFRTASPRKPICEEYMIKVWVELQPMGSEREISLVLFWGVDPLICSPYWLT